MDAHRTKLITGMCKRPITAKIAVIHTMQ